MGLQVLALQAARASGAEPTFDGQAMQAGVHLRWSFVPQLGFPPGAFWLLRRIGSDGEKRIVPPIAVQQAIDNAAASDPAQGGLGAVVAGPPGAPGAGRTGGKPGQAGTGCRCGCGCERGCDCGCGCGCERRGGCGCGSCGGGGTGGGGGGTGGGGGGTGGSGGGTGGSGTGSTSGPGWGATGPGWGPPDKGGWQLWGEPFTLPVTAANWPARYFGALDPLTTPAAAVTVRDIEECFTRLTGLKLAPGLSVAQEGGHFARLRAECARLVAGWPAIPNFAVPLADSPDGPSAPQLGLGLVQQFQISALSPYLARVIGLYFVDQQADPAAVYDYCIVGVWPEFAAPMILEPGAAPRGGLAAGLAGFDGMTITTGDTASHLYAWGGAPPGPDPAAPASVTTAFSAALAALPAADWPASMLAIEAPRPRFPWALPVPPGTVLASITLPNPVAALAVAVAGTGTLTAVAAGSAVDSAAFDSPTLTWVTLNAPSPATAPADTIEITSAAGTGVVVVALLATVPVAGSAAGVRYALVHAPRAMTAPPAPAEPAGIFRRRDASVELPGPQLVARSLFEVQWPPLPGPAQTGDPVTDPVALPPPDGAVAYIAEQADGNLTAATVLPRIIAAAPQPTPADSPLQPPPPAILRFTASGLADPVAGYQWRTAGFGLFGQLGTYSPWSSAVGVERIAAAPTALRAVSFDNSAAGGGHPEPAADPVAWAGGHLSLRAEWSGGSLLLYPDARTARLTVQALDSSGHPGPVITTEDFAVPAPAIGAYVLTGLVPDPARQVVYAITTPPLPALDPDGPPASLTLTGVLPGGVAVTERYPVRPGPVDPAADVQPPGVVATLPAGPSSRLTGNPALFLGQPAYLVGGVSVPLSLDVPLIVPVDQRTVRAQASVQSSRSDPFDPAETITDPNHVRPDAPEPTSAPAVFTGAQYLTPPPPPTPVHDVEHRWYQPADATGQAGYAFDPAAAGGVGFDTSAGLPAVSGYLLERAPGHSLALADVKRRLTAGLTDGNPAIAGRADLAAWIADLPGWLACYNLRTYGANSGAYLTAVTALADAAAQRALIEHFYGGLLDDELCVLADVPGNITAFSRVSPAPLPPGTVPADTVNGAGYGRNLYKLAAVNPAGSVSARSGAAGPVYTQPVRPSRPPVLYRVQPAPGAFVVAWVIDDNPDVAGYLVYRAASPDDLADLRYWGPDPAHPLDPSQLAGPAYDPTAWRGFTLTAGAADPRLVAVVADPRVFARDHAGSDMAEIPLPPGPAPDEVIGVYRLDEFDAGAPAGAQPQAFNYWRPDTGGGDGTAQVVTTGSGATAASRITGLRLGLGRGAPAVVVARYGQATQTLGTLPTSGGVPVRRVSFLDGAVTGSAPPAPLDRSAAPDWTPPGPGVSYYTVVAVDIAGNVSAAAASFGAAPALVPAPAGP